MRLLAKTLQGAAASRLQNEDVACAALYGWAAAIFDSPADGSLFISALKNEIYDRLKRALDRKDFALSLRLDGLSAIFDPESRSRVSQAVAAERANARFADAALAQNRGELEAAAAFSLAALAMHPEHQAARQALTAAAQGFAERYRTLAPNPPTLEGTLAVSLAVAAGAEDLRGALATLLYGLGDFETVGSLCRQIREDDQARFEDRFDAFRLALHANYRALGDDQAAAEARAVPDIRAWLAELGPPAQLEEAAIRTRVALCFNEGGYRRTLADLRELRRRTPDDPWVAHNLCVILHNALHPDVAEAVDLVVRRCSDEPADLRARYVLMSSIGATRQALILADRLARHNPDYAVIGALHEMATDLDAAPALIFGRERKGATLLYANLVCWGERYIDLMEQGAVASLLAPGNIPQLATKVDIVIELFTMPADVQRLRDSPPLAQLARYCEIRIYPFPRMVAEEGKSFGYLPYSYALHATALRAERDGADITFLMPDLIYADGAYGAIADKVTSEPRAVFVDGLNAYAAPMLEQMRPFHEAGVLVVAPQDLIDAAMGCLSKRTLHSLYAPDDSQTCAHPTRVIFPTAQGLRTHAFMMMPVYVSHAALAPFIMKNFGTQDGLMSEHILNGVTDEQLEVLSAREFCFVEICEDDGAFRPMTDFDLVTAVRDYFTRFSFGRNRLRLFSRPVEIPTRAPPEFPLVTTETADARVRDVQRMFATDPIMVDIAEEQERVRVAFYSNKTKAFDRRSETERSSA